MKSKDAASVLGLALTVLTVDASCASTPPDATSDPPPLAGGIVIGAGNSSAASTGPVAPSKGTLATFTPAEVLNIMAVANEDAIAQGQFATGQADSLDVKTFAEQLVVDHTQALARLRALQDHPDAPLDATSSLMERENELVTLDLQTQSGSSFNVAYMTTQVASLAKIIALLERSLLPSLAGAPSIEAELMSVRAMLVGHLIDALALQQKIVQSASFAGTGGTGVGGRPVNWPLSARPHK